MIEIDGAHGEGGGQLLRTALALSMCTQQAVRVHSIRANRPKRGLMRQHLTAVKAAAEVCGAAVEGAEVGSQTISFRPGSITPGDYSFDIGTAGSCTLVLQTVLAPLLTAKGSSRIRITGGTHNKAAPPVDFLQRAYLPLLQRMGADVKLELVRYGFYPRGGGELVATIEPVQALHPLMLDERGERLDAYAEAYIAAIPLHVAERELDTVGRLLHLPVECLHLRGLSNDVGPGNALTVTLVHNYVTEVFSGFGERGVTAETVAKAVCDKVQAYLSTSASVDSHLADQLLLPLVLARGGSFTTCQPSQHFESNVYVIGAFLPEQVRVDIDATGTTRVTVGL